MNLRFGPSPFVCLAALAGCLSIAPAGRGAPAAPQPLRGEAVSVSEHRGLQGRCHLMLQFTDDRLTNKLSILKARVTRAVDDTGTDLTLTGAPEFSGAGSNGSLALAAVRGWQDLYPVKKRYVSLQLTNAARRATAIAEIDGELELFTPTLQNGGVITIGDCRREPGRPLRHPRLAELGVTLTCLTKETYEAAKAAERAKSKPRFINPAEQQTDNLFPGILGEPTNTGRNYVVLRLDDPQKCVTSFAFGEPGGRLFPVTQRRSSDSMLGFYFQTTVPEDLMLYVYLAVPEALETVPFTVRNVVLP